MPYALRNKKKVSGATILWIILGVFYCACGITIICIWLTHKRNIKETGKVLLETKKSADAVIKEQLDTVSEIGGKKIGELTEHMVKAARPDEEDKAREEADAAAREALAKRLSELKHRKNQLDIEISVADSRHREATKTVPVTPAFDISDSDATRHVSAEQRALRAKLRKEADDAGRELRRLKIERQHVLHEIRQLEK